MGLTTTSVLRPGGGRPSAPGAGRVVVRPPGGGPPWSGGLDPLGGGHLPGLPRADFHRPDTEENVQACVNFGLAEGAFPVEEAAASIERAGTAREMLDDLADAGFGRLRRLQQRDVYFGALFPAFPGGSDSFQFGEQVPDPATLYGRLRDGGAWSRFGPTRELLEWAAERGVKVTLTPFNAGGGATLNVKGAANASATIPVGDGTLALDDDGRPYTVGDLQAARPRWQLGMMLCSGYGWDGFYWDDARSDWPADAKDGNPSARDYQRFVTNVWPTSVSDASYASAYARECARRKCLALVAFGQAVGEWIAGLPAELRAAIDMVEPLNEAEAFWVEAADPDDGAYVAQGQREAGRYVALLAGAIAAASPGARFRLEAGSWRRQGEEEDTFAASLAWLREVIGAGMVAEVEGWTRLVALRGGAVGTADEAQDLADWDRVCALAGVTWPPASGAMPAATELVQEVGWHWFHDSDHTNEGDAKPLNYADCVRLAADVRATRADLVDVLALSGFSLSMSCGALLFPAAWPGDPTEGSWSAGYYKHANDLFQASMLLRLVSTFVAAGGAWAGVFTFLASEQVSDADYQGHPGTLVAADKVDGVGRVVPSGTWREHDASGLRNEVRYPPAWRAFRQGEDAWPRAARYALRRLAWFLNRGGPFSPPAVSLSWSERGLTVVTLEFAVPLSFGPDGALLGGPWRRAHLLSFDQYATNDRLHPADAAPADEVIVEFGGALGAGPGVLLPALPWVRPVDRGALSSPRADANGYPEPREVVWDWELWRAMVVDEVSSWTSVTLRLRQLHPLEAPAPVWYLTDHGVSDVQWPSRIVRPSHGVPGARGGSRGAASAG